MRPRRREAQRAGAAAPEPRSTRYRNLVNPFEPVRIFSDDQVASMHRAALDILEHQGMRVLSARGLSVLRSAGARVDDSSQMVRLDPGMVSKAISTIPAEVALIARNPARSCRVGGRHVVFAPVAGPPSVSDLERGKRTATLEDYRDLVRLSQAFDVIHVLGQMVEPQDTSVSERHLETSLAQLTLGDKVPHFYCRGEAQLADCFAMLCIANGIDEATFRSAPRCYSICNTNSPLQLDVPMTDGIIDFAANGQLMIVTPFTLAGALARHIGAPWRCSSATASNAPDAQAVYESQMSLWGALLGGCHFMLHAAGWLEGGLTASLEKFILDIEMLQMFAELFQPVLASAEEIGVEAVAEVGPGGHFFAAAHTMQRYRDAFYVPLVSDWRNYGTWAADGAKTATERANARWRETLASFQQPALDAGVREALTAFVERRRREGGAPPAS